MPAALLATHDDQRSMPAGLKLTPAAVGASTALPQLVVFSDDWGRHPSSCQHLVRHLLNDCDITWINTIGTRCPKFDLSTLRRGMEKLLQWRAWQSPATSQQLPRVCNPMMWPGFRTRWERSLNRGLLARFLRRRVPQLDSAVVLSTIPVIADLVPVVNVKKWVYFCVDDFSAWPGLDSRPLRELEQSLVAQADLIVAAGDNLAARMEALGRKATVITHGIDLDHWSQSAVPDPLIQSLPDPVVVFWGLIDRRLDVEYLKALGQRMTSGAIVLVGPEQDSVEALRQVPRLHRLGPVPYERLPSIASAADVLVMPYADLPVTRAMQPLKLKEYLATGKPVVASRLPSVICWEHCLDVAESAAEFATAVLARAKEGTPPTQVAARLTLKNESWRHKAAALKSLLFGGA